MQSKQILITGLSSLLVCQPADLRRGAMVDLDDPGIETANRAESRGERNLMHGQRGLVDQFLGEMQTARLRHRDRSCAEVMQSRLYSGQIGRSGSPDFAP